MKKDFVRIQSNVTIMVTAGLQHDDVTNPSANIPDRLKVNPAWPRLTILIKQGAHWYPSEIAEWPTVKSLQKDKVLTIGEYSDKPEDANVEEIKTKKDELNAAAKQVLKDKSAKVVDIHLNDIVDD